MKVLLQTDLCLIFSLKVNGAPPVKVFMVNMMASVRKCSVRERTFRNRISRVSYEIVHAL